MKKHEILSPQSRATLFDPPSDVASIVRHYTFSMEDLALIRQKRRDANRLGFAIHLAYLRYPGRVLSPSEMLPKDMLAFIAHQLQVNPSAFLDYGQREATRWEHLNELYAYLGLRPFRHDDEPTIARIAREEAIETDRGDAIVCAMVSYLRQNLVVLPAATELERIALTARAQVRKRTYRSLVDGLTSTVRARLSDLIEVAEDQNRTPLAWLRD
jgi:hypothetical protein